MSDEYGEKSHDPTPRRRQQVREQGHVAQSQDLSSAVLLLAGLLLLLFAGGGLVRYFDQLAHRQLGGEAWLSADLGTMLAQYRAVIWSLGAVLLPLFTTLLLVAILVNLGQVGFLFLPHKLALDVSRVSPVQGAQRIFSPANAVRLGLGLFKVVVVCGVAGWSVWSQRETLLSLGGRGVPQVAVALSDMALWTCLKAGAALLLLAILDYGYQRWRHEQDLRMTTQEIREEMKTLQGDPLVIARRRTVQRQLVLNRLSNSVPRADVIVSDPDESAIAIAYDPENMAAPSVVAKGAGVLAQRIRRLGGEHGIPIVERKPLAGFLYRHVEVREEIPSEQYQAVADVLQAVSERQVDDARQNKVPGHVA